jgi:hypothetical protein
MHTTHHAVGTQPLVTCLRRSPVQAIPIKEPWFAGTVPSAGDEMVTETSHDRARASCGHPCRLHAMTMHFSSLTSSRA